MKIVHIEFAKTGTNLSGGEVCMLEIMREFQHFGHINVLLTTDNGAATYKKYYNGSVHPEYIEVPSYSSEKKYGVFISYIIRTIRAVRMVKQLDTLKPDYIICHSEFFPNSIPYYFLMKKYPTVKNSAFYHMKAPSIFKGYEGEFTNKLQFPRPTIIHYNLNQYLFRKLTPANANILTVNNYYKKFLETKYPHNKIVVLNNYGQGDVKDIADAKKDIDLLWVGRFHAQKGLMDFLAIVKEIARQKRDVKAVIVGDGDTSIKSRAIRFIEQENLVNNVRMVGFLTGDEKASYFKKSRIYAMTSTYESFGQVVLEAMSYKVPVIAYALPVYEVFGEGITKVNVLDTECFAASVLDILSSEEIYQKKSNDSAAQAMRHSWKITSEKILDSITK